MSKLKSLNLGKLYVRQATGKFLVMVGVFDIGWRNFQVATGVSATISNHAAVTSEVYGGISILLPDQLSAWESNPLRKLVPEE